MVGSRVVGVAKTPGTLEPQKKLKKAILMKKVKKEMGSLNFRLWVGLEDGVEA